MATIDTVTRPKITYGDVTLPASYAAGGFAVDLSATVDFIQFYMIIVPAGSALGDVTFEYTYNQNLAGFAIGQAKIKIMRNRYDEATMGAPTNLPASVTLQASKTATATTTGSAHTHTINHDHPLTTSGAPTAAGAGVDAGLGGALTTTHTHNVDIAAFTGSTPSDGTHTHDRSFEYEHSHGNTQAATNTASVEVANGTSLSAITLRYMVVGT